MKKNSLTLPNQLSPNLGLNCCPEDMLTQQKVVFIIVYSLSKAPKQIGPNWDPDLCPTVWVRDRGLCEEEASSWGIFAQRYVSGFEPAETSELAQLGFQYDVDGYMAALSSRPSFKCGGNNIKFHE